MNSGWFLILRSILELLYFISGAVLTGVAIYGLRQLSLTKRIANNNARRESIKFAAERCQYYADKVVPLAGQVGRAYEANKCTFLANQKFEVAKGEIVSHNFNSKGLVACQREIGPIIPEVVAYLNSVEAFAIPFVARVADDELGFQEVAASFCNTVSHWMVVIYLMRTQGVRFESCIRLYESWSARLEAEKMKPLVQSMSAKIKSAEQGRFTSLEGS